MPPRSRMTKAELLEALEKAEAAKNDSMEMFSTRIPASLKKRIKHASINFDGGTQALVTQAIEEFLNREED